MFAGSCLAGSLTLAAFIFAFFHPNVSAAVIFGLASALAWAVGSTAPAPSGLNAYLNVVAASFAAAAVGFSAPHV